MLYEELLIDEDALGAVGHEAATCRLPDQPEYRLLQAL